MTVEANAIYGGPAVHKTSRLNPTKVLLELRERHPTDDKATVLEMFRVRMLKLVREEDDWLTPLADAYFYREWNNIDQYETRTTKAGRLNTPVPRKPTAANQENMKERIRLAVLDTLLPDGRAAREHTFADIGKFGGFWTHLSMQGKPSQKVGDMLSDSQVQAMWAKWIRTK
jgi:hypothetical protein